MTDDQYQEMFDNYWLEIIEYANEIGVTPRYLEEEFILDGELFKIDPSKLTKRVMKKIEYSESEVDMYFGSSYESDIDNMDKF